MNAPRWFLLVLSLLVFSIFRIFFRGFSIPGENGYALASVPSFLIEAYPGETIPGILPVILQKSGLNIDLLTENCTRLPLCLSVHLPDEKPASPYSLLSKVLQLLGVSAQGLVDIAADVLEKKKIDFLPNSYENEEKKKAGVQ